VTVLARKRVTIAFSIFLVSIGLGGFLVGRSAQGAVLASQSGSVSEVILDPSSPGFRAFTETTPTVLAVHTSVTSSGAQLTGATILTPADADSGGTVVSVHSTFAAAEGASTLSTLFATDGLDSVVDTLAQVTGVGFSDVVVLDASSWTALMREDLPLNLSLRTDLVEVEDGVTSVLVSAGTGEYDLLDVARIVSHQNPSEPSLGLALRQQEVWRSWISRTAGSENRPELFELDNGFSAVIGALASGEVSYRTIPATTLAADAQEMTSYIGQPQQILELFAQVVPFPLETAPGDRPSVLLLDSTLGEIDRDRFVELVTLSGGRVTVLGNGNGEPEAANRVQLHDPSGADLAEALAGQLDVLVENLPLEDATTAVTVVMAEPIASS